MRKHSSSKKHARRTPEQIAFARDQRQRANSFADAVWQLVRNRGCRSQKFRREYPIPPFTADFCCVELKLIVEIDGEAHLTEEGRDHDRYRDRFLAKQGYTVLRIPGYQVSKDLHSVLCLIESAIEQRVMQLSPLTPNPSPPQSRGRGEPV